MAHIIISSIEVNVTLPSDLQLSAAPLSGKIKIKCVSPEGYVSYTNAFNAGYDNMGHIEDAIHQKCNLMGVIETIDVKNPGDYPYWQNGFSYQIFFKGY
jgi:hypothetical protein